MSTDAAHHASYPTAVKQAAGNIHGTETSVSSTYFADKIMITISQDGRLSQWVQVPTLKGSPFSFDTGLRNADSDMLPLDHLTPMTLLGAGGDQRETMGHLIASQITSTILTQNPDETRTVLVGLGLQDVNVQRAGYFDLLELVQKVI